MAVKRVGGLGRGVNALISSGDDMIVDGASSINEISIAEIEANLDQPRKDFDEESLEELAESIRQVGVIQPISLKKLENGKYMIIAGERRFRASKMAGKTTIPAYVREVNDDLMMEMALVENIQREDLNAIEIALSCQNLMEKCNYTQEQLSERIGKKRATVTNYLRLLRLPADIQMALKDKKIDMGHARALVSVEDPVAQLNIFSQILAEGLSVRKVEELVRNLGVEKKPKAKSSQLDLKEEYSELKSRLSDLFSSKVDLSCDAKGKGKITISFKNDDEFLKILEFFDSIQNH
ncbi:MAG: ParB/RepB/Spo0J family partition protein [Paludibacteraceae bacterium]|nr:ParB/RepB/Spo0J family partition protein [Paludibacteraceae bacterium]MEE0912145.1 ParB/RepB/Spo0J family partition protein [Paludibacteraceae bacterium]